MIKDDLIRYNDVLRKLVNYVERNDFSGFDLYDGLKITNNHFLVNNFFTNTLITQFFKKSPVNFRSLIGIKPTTMPKSFGIFLHAYSSLIANETDENKKNTYLQKSEYLLQWLNDHRLKNYSGACWNFGFNYKFMFDAPTGVITSIIAKGLHEYYLVTGSDLAKEILIDIKNFILNDLPITTVSEGICFSYTPAKKDCCYNASMLAVETLSRIYSITHDNSLLETIQQALDFVIAHQKSDGRWNYSIALTTNKEREQVDFHQGYILESLYEILRLTQIDNSSYKESLEKGTLFYRSNQFFNDGRAKWRIPKEYPIDIHNQAQGIIYFSIISKGDDGNLLFAKNILDWTIQNMLSEEGYFFYQTQKFYKNKISYMRWSQAWMMLALSKFLYAQRRFSELQSA